MPFNESFLSVQGESMLPLLEPGDQVEVRWLSGQTDPDERLEVGDLVVWRDEKMGWIVHRVISLSPLRLKGDSALAWDCPSIDEIWGKVVSITKKDGRRLLLPELASPLARAVAVCSAGAIPCDTLRAKVARRLAYVFAQAEKSRLGRHSGRP